MYWLLIILASAGGTLATYFYDEDAHPLSRLAAGVVTGFAALGLAGFVLASLLGFGPASVALATLFAALPLALLLRADWRARVWFDIGGLSRAARHGRAEAPALTGKILLAAVVSFAMLWLVVGPAATPLLLLAVAVAVIWFAFGRASVPVYAFLGVALLFRLVYSRAMFTRGGEIYTGVDNNLGDLPFHLAIINGFVHGENFPPAHPEYAGARLTYPFSVDFVAAMLVRAGAGVESALFWENLLLALALVVLLYRFAVRLTGERLAGLFAVLLTLFSGGLGWATFLREWVRGASGLWELLWHLPHDYTITHAAGGYRWGNAITTLFVPQRGLLMGLPLALVVITQWWIATREAENGEGGKRERDEKEEAQATLRVETAKGKKGKGKKQKQRQPEQDSPPPRLAPFSFLPSSFALSGREARMLGAGVVAGLLPLVHAHSFVVLMLVAGCLALLLRGWRGWFIFFAAAFVVAAPQMWWATRESAARPENFFEWMLGWDRGRRNPVWFWIRNTGPFIPLLAAALAWRGRRPVVPRRLLVFYLPFTLLFLICNAAKISPWVWDNIKVLFYWYVASVPLVALLIVRLWRLSAVARAGALALLLMLTAAGALDVWRVVSGASEQREFGRDGAAFAELVRSATAPRSLILHAPTYNHPVYLTGRQSLMGYGGHLWSQGIDYAAREADIRRIYAGAADAHQLLARHGVEYVVVGPLERAELKVINEQFFAGLTKVGETSGYRLYKVARP
jgi:hypothetical protein